MHLIRRHINILLPLTVITACSRVFPAVSSLYYLVPILLILFIAAGFYEIKSNSQLRIYLRMLLAFGVWAGLTSFWSDYPLISLGRAAYFLLAAFGITLGVILWFKEFNNNNNIFEFLLPANVLIVISSMVSLILGFPENAWSGGNGMGFMGFAIHQNTLSALILFTFPVSFYHFLKGIDNIKIKIKEQIANLLFYILLLVSNIYLLILTHSRASLLALAVGVILTFLLYFNKRQKIYFIGSLTIIAVVIAITPSLSSRMTKYIYKGTPTITANRDILWKPSYEAAKIGSLFGIGYGISHPEIINNGAGSHFENKRYVREKGNSILALVEEVGIVGLILFFIPIIYVFILLFKPEYYEYNDKNPTSRNQHLNNIFLISFIISFLLHSQFESWMTGVSSFYLLTFIIFLANSLEYNYESV